MCRWTEDDKDDHGITAHQKDCGAMYKCKIG